MCSTAHPIISLSNTAPESVSIYGQPLTLMRVLLDYIADKFGGLGSLPDVRTVGYWSVVEAGLGVLLVWNLQCGREAKHSVVVVVRQGRFPGAQQRRRRPTLLWLLATFMACWTSGGTVITLYIDLPFSFSYFALYTFCKAKNKSKERSHAEDAAMFLLDSIETAVLRWRASWSPCCGRCHESQTGSWRSRSASPSCWPPCICSGDDPNVSITCSPLT